MLYYGHSKQTNRGWQMYVLVELSNNKRRYFETAHALASYLIGKRVDKFRIEVFKYAGQVTEIPAAYTEMVERLNIIASR